MFFVLGHEAYRLARDPCCHAVSIARTSEDGMRDPMVHVSEGRSRRRAGLERCASRVLGQRGGRVKLRAYPRR
jgi:hypothetical protein